MKITWLWTGKEATVEEIKSCVGKGWGGIIEKLIQDLEALGWDGGLFQVKEKFGGLRFYTGVGNAKIFKRVSQAEKESYKVCEVCGEPGKLYPEGWWSTRCKKCYRKRID